MKCKIGVVLFLTIVIALCGCLGKSIRSDSIGWDAYIMARQMLNDYWEMYLDYRDALPAEKRAEFVDKFKNRVTGNSYFVDADLALDHWSAVINSEEEAAAALAYNKIYREIVLLMLQYDILEIE